jgi:anti-sigma28 factor (negative regulator of flagellin synthesis)
MKARRRRGGHAPQSGHPTRVESGGSAVRPSPVAGTDVMDVPEAARVLARIWIHVTDLAAGLCVVREERVAALRECIRAGQYRPDLRDVARKFLVEELAFAAG